MLACSTALGALALAASPASSSPSPGALGATLEGATTGGTAWCCGHGVDFAGSGVVPKLGAVDFTADWLGGCSFATLPTPCFTRLELVLVARNGDRLTLRGNDEWTRPSDPEPAAMTWTSDPAASTGRFAGFTASGTYTLVEAPSGSTASITLSGVLESRRLNAE